MVEIKLADPFIYYLSARNLHKYIISYFVRLYKIINYSQSYSSKHEFFFGEKKRDLLRCRKSPITMHSWTSCELHFKFKHTAVKQVLTHLRDFRDTAISSVMRSKISSKVRTPRFFIDLFCIFFKVVFVC